MSTSLQFILIATFAGAVALWHAAQMIVRRQHEYSRWIMCVLIIAGCLGFIFQIPALYSAIDRIAGVANLSYLLACISFALCAGLIHLWISTWPGIAPASARTLIVAGAVGCALLAALFAAGTHPTERNEDFVVAYIHDPATAAMIVCYLALFCASWPLAALRVREGRHRASRGARRWLVHGLGFLELGVWSAAGYSLALVAVPVTAAAGLSETERLVSVANSLGALSATFSCIGFAARTWGPGWDRYLATAFTGYRERVRFRQLAPLYRLVVRSGQSTLQVPRGLGLRRRASGAALTHQVVAITEALTDLAPYLDADVEDRAREWGDALVEAIVVNAAVAARRDGRTPARTADLPHHGDLRQETAHHARLSAALALLSLLDLDQGLPTAASGEDPQHASSAAPQRAMPEPATRGG